MREQLLLETVSSPPALQLPLMFHGSEPSLSLIAEHTMDVIMTIDSHSRIHYANSATEKLFGYSKEELIGQKLTMLMPESHRQLHLRGIEAYVNTGQRHVDWNVAMLPGLHKDGHTISLGISFGEYTAEGERMFIGIARDIAGPSRIIEELRQAKKDAEATEHSLALSNKAKDRFLAIVSHELRSPLTPILAALDALKSDELQPFVEIIQRNVELEVRLINDLLDLTRMSKGKFQLRIETIDLHKLLHEVIAIYKTELTSRKLRLDMRLEATRYLVQGDPARLDQVFWNLIKNAMKFTPEGGSVTVRTRDVGDRVVVEVSDTGIGIEPALLKRIFEAFEQGNQAPGFLSGLGLGLTISKELVEAHDGTISAASEGTNKGSTFRVELATATVNAPQSATLIPSKPAIALNGKTIDKTNAEKKSILIVDDQIDTSATLRILLSRRGYHVKTAKSIAEAIEIVAEAPVDLVISDIMLPDGTGIEMLPKLRKIRNVSAIALSGLGSDADIQRSLAAGFQQHITKPFNFNMLLESIATYAA